MCVCENLIESNYHTAICMDCGLENRIGLSIVVAKRPYDMCPFPTGYCRYKRFGKLADAFLFPTPALADNSMLEFLSGRTYGTIHNLTTSMKASKLRDKRYMSIHLFSKLFVRSYKRPKERDYYRVKKKLMRAFEEVDFAHINMCSENPFFNYAWLLAVLLGELRLHDLVPYVKNLRCKHRRKFYTAKLGSIRSAYKRALIPEYVSESHTQSARQSGGPPSPLHRLQPSGVSGAARFQTHVPGHTDGTRSDFEE